MANENSNTDIANTNRWDVSVHAASDVTKTNATGLQIEKNQTESYASIIKNQSSQNNFLNGLANFTRCNLLNSSANVLGSSITTLHANKVLGSRVLGNTIGASFNGNNTYTAALAFSHKDYEAVSFIPVELAIDKRERIQQIREGYLQWVQSILAIKTLLDSLANNRGSTASIRQQLQAQIINLNNDPWTNVFLGIAESVSGMGQFQDLISAVRCLNSNDYQSAWISLASIAPLMGSESGFMLISKKIEQAIDLMQSTGKPIKWAPKIENIYQAVKDGYLNAWKNDKLFKGATGGAYRDLTENESNYKHYIPSLYSGMPPAEGGCILLTKPDHYQTADFAFKYPDFVIEQKKYIDNVDFERALRQGIDDIKSKFSNTYSSAIDELIMYYQSIGLLNENFVQ